MAYPPRSRRTKIRRRARFAATAAAVCTVAAGFSYIDETHFDARSAAMTGTPVTLRVERGVAPSDTGPIRNGIRAADSYSRRLLGRPVRDRVEARVAGSSGCGLLSHTDGIPVG